MNNEGQNLDKAIQRAKKGEFKEYWLQLYIKDNYKKLGFDSLEGPFETGYDFKGVYKGKKVVVEAERRPGEFVKHKHNPNEVDILIILSNEDDGCRIRGMTREKWERHLPKKIIPINPEDFVKSTHEMRKDCAIKKQKEENEFTKLLPFLRIKSAFGRLWNLLIEEIPNEGTPEYKAFDEALDFTAIEYIKTYNLDLNKLREESVFTRIENLDNDLIKSRREFNDLTSEEKEFLENWVEVIRSEYGSRI